MNGRKPGSSPTTAKTFKKSLLALSILTLGAPVLAQSDAANQNMEEVIVTGMRSSIQSAQELKRNADTVIDAITASDMGALPDKSVTEALQRVPGVTIDHFASSDDPNHFADEGTGVLVRGLDRVRSEINGRDSFSANPYGGLNYEDISPELLGAVEVVKNQTADRIAGGIAGTVNLKTRKPFDAPGQMAAFSVKTNYGDFREEVTPSFSGLYSNRFEGDLGEFGFLLSASNSQLKTRGDRIGVANFYSRGDVDGVDGGPLTGQESGTVLYMPGQASVATAENDRDREGYAVSLQWKAPNDSVEITLEHIRSNASLIYREHVIGQQEQGFVLGAMTTTNLDAGADDAVFDNNGFFVSGSTINNPLLLSSRWNSTTNSVGDTSLHFTIRPSDKLTLDLDVQNVNSRMSVQNYGVNDRSMASDMYLDLSGDLPKIEYTDPLLSNPDTGIYSNNYIIRSVMEQNNDNDANATSYQAKAKYEIEDSWITSVSAGGYYSEKNLTVRDTEYSNWGAVACGWWGCADTSKQTYQDPWSHTAPMATLPDGVPEAQWMESIANFHNTNQFLEQVTFDNFFESSSQLQGQNTFYFPKMSLVQDLPDFIRTLQDGGYTCLPQEGCIQSQRDKPNRIAEDSPYAPHQVSSVVEQRKEFFVRADFAFDELSVPLKGNLGLRTVSYQLASTGFAMYPSLTVNTNPEWYEAASPGIFDFADGGFGEQSTVKAKEYTSVLPSFNLAAELKEDLIARFGYSKGLYFPTLVDARNNKVMALDIVKTLQDPSQPESDTNPAIGVSAVNVVGTSRNPNLRPEESTNLDLSVEWYFSKAGSLTTSLFHKNIDNLFRDRFFTESVTNNGQTRTVSFSGPNNSGSGSIQGIELSYSQFFDMLPGAWSGLGVQMNYTYIDQKDLNDKEAIGEGGAILDPNGGEVDNGGRNSFRNFTDLPLPSYSKNSYNLVGMYEYAGISARLAYNWRSGYLISRRDSNEFAPIYTQDTGYLDGSIYYSINDNVQVGLEASNLLNTITRNQTQLNQAGDKTDEFNFITDRRYALSLRAKF